MHGEGLHEKGKGVGEHLKSWLWMQTGSAQPMPCSMERFPEALGGSPVQLTFVFGLHSPTIPQDS